MRLPCHFPSPALVAATNAAPLLSNEEEHGRRADDVLELLGRESRSWTTAATACRRCRIR